MATRNSPLVVAAENVEFNGAASGTLKWHKSTPQHISAAGAWGPGTDGWIAWTRHLTRRSRPKPLSQRLPSRGSPLAWSLPAERLAPGTPSLIARLYNLGQKKRRVLLPLAGGSAAWMNDIADPSLSLSRAVECLAWCHALPALADVAPADDWWGALSMLVDAADTDEIELESDPLTHQLVSGELPLSLAYLFPEIQACRALAARGRRSLSAGLDVLLDGEGLPAARHLELLRPLLACWTRSRALAEGVKHGCWDEPAQMQYEWVVRQAMRFSRADGGQPLCVGAAGAWEPELFDAALAIGGDADDAAIARVALPKRRKPAGSERAKLPPVAYHCEWAETALLRTGWPRGGPLLAVAWHDRQMQTELAVGRHVLWSGTCETQLRFEGTPAVPQSDWEVVCWESDEDADYLELELELSEGIRLQRQLLLAREDELLFMADAVLAEGTGRIEYESAWPLDPRIQFEPAEKHHEAALSDGKPRARVLPLGLPEWRRQPAAGRLDCADHRLQIYHTASGRAMYVPVLIDLDVRRLARPFTWRSLTVAEDRNILSAETAVGYRVQLGSQQWLIYRSLAEPASRTLLGHNLVTEFLFAQFQRDGEVEPLMEVE